MRNLSDKIPMKWDQQAAVQAQLKSILDSPDIPPEKKLPIGEEFIRLMKRHPTWKFQRAMRKAGEIYRVKITLAP
jgi:hypothetical protein